MVAFTIEGSLPGLNEYTKACRTNPYTGAKMKRECEEFVMWTCKNIDALIIGAVVIDFKWIEKDRRRDPDNISSFGRKVILDALVKTGIITDDSQEYILGFRDFFEVDAENPRIEVAIREAGA